MQIFQKTDTTQFPQKFRQKRPFLLPEDQHNALSQMSLYACMWPEAKAKVSEIDSEGAFCF